MTGLEVGLSIFTIIMMIISIGKYRYENGYSKYSKKQRDIRKKTTFLKIK